MKSWVWAAAGLVAVAAVSGVACSSNDTTGAGGNSETTQSTATSPTTSTTSPPTSSTMSTSTSSPVTVTTGSTTPMLCGQADTSTMASAACDSCITASCCTEFEALGTDMNAVAYLQCVLGPNLDGMGGCEASAMGDETTFQTCWDGCVASNEAGAAVVDQLNTCAFQNHCTDGSLPTTADNTACQQFLLAPGFCDTGFTLITAQCDACMSTSCCTEGDACLSTTDQTCGNDWDTCLNSANQSDPVCTSDADAGALATCEVSNCAVDCGLAGAGGGGQGGNGGGTAGTGGSGGDSGTGGSGGAAGTGGAGGHG